MSKGPPVVSSELVDRVMVITLDRPQARNALNRQLLAELQAAVGDAAADDRVGVLVLTGNGPAFCAGADLKEAAAGMRGQDFWARYERTSQSLYLHHELPRLAKPVIAAVNGPAVAGGCGLAMSCDLVWAADTATFGYPEVNRGLVAAMVMVSLSRVVGRRHALDLLLSGRRIDAQEALQIGMLNRVVGADVLHDEVMAYAQELAHKPASALRLTKGLFHQVSETDYDRALEWARDVNQMVGQTRDAQAGAEGFANRSQGSTA